MHVFTGFKFPSAAAASLPTQPGPNQSRRQSACLQVQSIIRQGLQQIAAASWIIPHGRDSRQRQTKDRIMGVPATFLHSRLAGTNRNLLKCHWTFCASSCKSTCPNTQAAGCPVVTDSWVICSWPMCCQPSAWGCRSWAEAILGSMALATLPRLQRSANGKEASTR